MASDSNIDRAIGRLSPRRLASSSSSSSSRSTSPRHNTNSTTTTSRQVPPDLLPGHHRPGQLHIHGRTRSLSISSRASGFSHEDLVRPTLTFADDQGKALASTSSRDCAYNLYGTSSSIVFFRLVCIPCHHHDHYYRSDDVSCRLAHGTPTTHKARSESISMEEDHACSSLPGCHHVALDMPLHRSVGTSFMRSRRPMIAER